MRPKKAKKEAKQIALAQELKFYVVLMFVLVFAGTVLDILHKQSATYFFRNAKKAEAQAKTPIDSATKKSLAIKTVHYVCADDRHFDLCVSNDG